jgi:NTE family protein
MDASQLQGGLGELAERIGMAPFRRLAVVIVNAATRRGAEWNRREAVPGVLHSIQQLGDNIGDQVNHRSIELFQQLLDDWRRKAREGGPTDLVPLPDYYLVTVNFEEVSNPAERRFLRNLPTSFTLPDETVDRLTAAGGRLLRESAEFQRLLKDLASGEAGKFSVSSQATYIPGSDRK